MDGGNNPQQSLKEEIARILPQQGSSGATPPPVFKPRPVTPPPVTLPPRSTAPAPRPVTPPPIQPVPKPVTPPPVKPTTPQVRPPENGSQKFVVRTMPSDLESLKKGEAPSGSNIEKSGQVTPRPTTPLTPPPKLEIGKVEKAAPITPPSIQPAPKPIIPDLGSILPPKSGAVPPKAPVTPAPAPAPAPITPPSGKKSNLLGLIIIVLGLAILGYAGFWYFTMREEPLPSPSPTPSLTPTPTPVADEFEAIFGAPEPIVINSTEPDLVTSLVQIIDSQLVNLDQIRSFVVVDETGHQYDFVYLMQLFGITVPADLAQSLDTGGSVFIIYGQTEEFDDRGNLVLTSGSTTKFKRIGFVVKTIDPSAAKVAAKAWEPTMKTAVTRLLQLGGKRAASTVFNDNLYKGVGVRYINYPNPDLSIDYAISSASNGENYFVLTNSREEIYAIVDKLLGFLSE